MKVLINHEGINPNEVNQEDESTTFGLMFYHATVDTGYYLSKGYKSDELIKLFHDKFGNTLDIHKPQIMLKHNLETPISLIVEKLVQGSHFDLEVFVQRKDW